MKIFLSYPSAHKDTAASICYELQAEGHDVFFDREDLPAGQSYNAKIRKAIEASDLVIFLITPDAVAPGRYTLTELKLTRLKWPNPDGHLLPVMLEPTPFDDLPPYLGAVTVLTPEGNVAAEILMEIARFESVPVSTPEAAAPDRYLLEAYRYQPVEIRFGAGVTGTYPLAVTESPTGRLASAPCAVDPRALENALWSSSAPVDGALRRDHRGPGDAPENLLPSAQDAKQVGQELYALLFNSHIRSCLDSSLRSVDAQRREGLRFLINTTEAPDLARLPWEFLYSPEQDDFLFSNQMTPLIRWLDVDQPPPTLAVEPPLRLLMAVAAPHNRPDLSVGDEIAHLDDALGDLITEGRVNVVRLDHATLEGLDDALLREKPHVLHFIGHGDFTANEGVVVLESQTTPGEADPITGRKLGVLLRNHLASLRFVFLNSCLGAAASRHDPFGGVAQSLIRRGIPAVIAMQFPIPDRAAVTLARHFYRYLAAGLPVDTALTSARAFLFARGHEVEWGAPTLHMRTPDGRLFEVGEQGAAGDDASPPAPAAPPRVDHRPTERPEAAPVAKGPSRSGLWKWVVLALVAGIAALAAFWWSTPQEAVVPPSSVKRPDFTEPAKVDPLTSPSLSTKSAAVRYREALEALRADNINAALALIEQAQAADPQGAVLAMEPELRAGLVDGFADAARRQFPFGDLEQSRRIAGAHQALALDASQARALLEVIDKLTVYRQVLPVRGGGDTDAALTRLEAARQADPAGALLSDFPALRDRLFDAFLAAVDQEMPFDSLARLIDALIWLDPDRAAQVEALAESWGMEDIEPAAGPPPAAGGDPAYHQVLRGDTLWDIAASHYGDPTRWPQIYGANRDLIRDPDLIYPGQQFAIPASAFPMPFSGGYQVRKGDSLWRIAAWIYGDPTRWTQIYAANRDRIRDPDLIFPNQQFIIPQGDAGAQP